MRKILKEPLLIFLLLGVAVFALFQLEANDYRLDSSEIVVTEGQIKALSLGFEKAWQRSPNEKEVAGIIQNYIREEVFYREALAMGLDQGDSVVRRRLTQKMEFLSEDIANLEKPTEQELQTYLAAHQQDYRKDSRISFRQIYFNTSKRGQSAKTGAMALLAKLQTQDTDAATLGDPSMLKQEFINETETEVGRALGSQFVQSLSQLPIGLWQGPVSSGFGLHLVRIDERIESEEPKLNEVREQVVRDWESKKRIQTNETLYKNLRKRYTVRVEKHSQDDVKSENTSRPPLNE